VVRDNPLLAAGPLRAFFGGNLFGAPGADLLFRPMWLLSLKLDRALFGTHALPMHAVNVALHAVAALLLYRLLLRLVDDDGVALVGALLFAVHPVHLDAVAFLVNRSELLAFVGLALAMLALLRDPAWRAWLRGEPTPTPSSPRWPLVAAAAAFAAALLAKETAAGALPVLALVAALRARRGLRPPPTVLAGLALFVAVFAGYLVARHAALGALTGTSAAAWIQDRRAAVLVPTVARIFADYVRLMVAPYPLRVDYSDFVVSGGPLDPRALAAYALHAALFALGVFWLRRRRNAALALFAFYAALVPVSHLFPFREIEAERFLYLPSAFACALGAALLPRRAGALAVVLYGLLCFTEALHFHSAEALWATMVERSPRSARAHYNLGTAELEAGRCDLAVARFERALTLAPNYARAWTNLGECLVALGSSTRAGEALATAARLDDGNPRAHRNLAVFRALHGDVAGARRELDRARALAPDEARDATVQKLIDTAARRQ
jgi:protein O-mannosyl-transferase